MSYQEVREKCIRTIKNTSEKKQGITPDLGVQEWFHKEGQSKIIKFEYKRKDGEWESVKTEKTTTSKDFILGLTAQNKIDLKPQEEIIIVWESSEIKMISDQTMIVFGTASLNPEIKIDKLPEGVQADVTFYTRHGKEIEDYKDGHYQLKGALLPRQAIRIRWWVKEEAEKWKAGFHEKKHGI